MCHIVCKTLTNAQRMAKYLGRNGVKSQVKRLPSELRENNGCGYAISVSDENLRHALNMLREINVTPLRLYKVGESGVFEEIS